jgi:glycosyltransferase involved in cell wall biosynthesis
MDQRVGALINRSTHMLRLPSAGAGVPSARLCNLLFRQAARGWLMPYRLGFRFWRSALSRPAWTDEQRIELGQLVHAGLTAAHRPAEAELLIAAVARRLADPALKAAQFERAATADLAAARCPAYLSAAVSAQLAMATASFRKRQVSQATTWFWKAASLLFHRAVHFDALTSPLATDPQRFLRPLYRSAAARFLMTPRGRHTAAALPPTERPQRILFAYHGNDNFLREIRRRYEEHPDTEVACLNLADDPVGAALTTGRRMITYLFKGASADGDPVEAFLRPHLNWADTIFVDWCTAHAVLLTLADPGTTRVILRLHSFETFTVWPHLVDPSRVDDVVFVSEHLRDLTLAAVPALAGPHGHVLTNAMNLRRYAGEKPASARFTLGLVGVGSIAKDPRWAIEVLRLLRRHDDRYRLSLIGTEINPSTSAAAASYAAGYRADLAEFEAAGAIRRLGATDDVPAALRDIGVILSASVRESFHCALAEGAASGAVPVVRDWPFFAGRPHGARTTFPADWVVASPTEAAERILTLTATEDVWRTAGLAAAEHALATWDWSVTAQDFDGLLLAPGSDE